MKKLILLYAQIYSSIINIYFGFKKVIFIGHGILFINKKTIFGEGTTIYGRFRIEVIGENSILEIGKKCSIAENLHLTCGKKIKIEDNVSIANNVTITDINHTYTDISVPIGENLLSFKGVQIGTGSFIGCNVYIAPGVTIGKHCFIGANSVVLSSFDDFSIIGGTPARLIKKIQN